MLSAIEHGATLSIGGEDGLRLTPRGAQDWFFIKEHYGGILCDIGSHQIEQYLYFASEEDARVVSSRIANDDNAARPEPDDFGGCTITGKNGTTNDFRVDWFTPTVCAPEAMVAL